VTYSLLLGSFEALTDFVGGVGKVVHRIPGRRRRRRRRRRRTEEEESHSSDLSTQK
jgi:hypothetical protein